jgi:pSer/pThr/pTyr-binding forkhead associated (FHA) protein
MSNMPGNQPSAAPVGFKSKVVSRRHCEFWYEDGKWYIKDVKSSSGTFLNHIRLSPPSQESKAFPVNDGDIVQLGIDFKGGEEMIFRCVKMRLELNRGWQNKLNSFKYVFCPTFAEFRMLTFLIVWRPISGCKQWLRAAERLVLTLKIAPSA